MAQGAIRGEIARILDLSGPEFIALKLDLPQQSMKTRAAVAVLERLLRELSEPKGRSLPCLDALGDFLLGRGDSAPVIPQLGQFNPLQLIVEAQKRLDGGPKPAPGPAEIAAELAD